MRIAIYLAVLCCGALGIAWQIPSAQAQQSALMTSGMGGGASSTARLSAVQMQQKGRIDDIQTCGNKGKFFGPAFGVAGDRDADDCLTAITITSGGNVGIGKASPAQALDVLGAVGADDLLVSWASGSSGWSIEGGTTSIATLRFDADRARFWSPAGSEIMSLLENGNVGIGTTAPATKLHVVGGFGLSQSGNSLEISTDSDLPSFIRLRPTAGTGLGITGNNNTVGLFVSAAGSNVGIGTTTPTQKLDVTGNALVSGSVTANAFFYSSDRNLKNDIRSFDWGLKAIARLKPVRFTWKKDGTPSLGFIAQDVEQVLPEAVSTNGEGIKAVDYGKLTAPLVAAIKEQQAQIEAQRAQIADLMARLATLETAQIQDKQ